MTEYVKKQIKKTKMQDIRDNAELFVLVCIFIFSTMGVSPSV